MKIPKLIEKEWALITSGAVDIIPEEELIAKMEHSRKTQTPLRVKYGADPSAPDIHLGHTVPIRKLRQFQEFGHTVVFIIGDFTARIGDPTGRSATRKRLSPEEVETNSKTYMEQIYKILDPEKTELVYNSTWFESMNFTKAIELGAKYTVSRMMERDDFKKRLSEERPIFIHEFLYPLVQGYDSVEVRADIELGGTDQKFNFLVAREIQREYGLPPQCILTFPLLVGIDGVNKMSKSLGNYIGITEPAREIFGKTMSIADHLMGDYFELVLGYSRDEADRFRKGISSGEIHPRDLKARLAREIVTLYHDGSAAREAEEEFNRVFKQKENPDEIEEKSITAEKGEISITAILTATGMAPSGREARRIVLGGGVSVDGSKVDSPDASFKPGEYIFKVGKRRFIKALII
ncbi:tyrosine--tRNA ligase [Candidatus Sumerlaeota bacterium]|nr:tyrosine--tRNA ligase [Candidatus Sumerlaeota bacterium]